MSSPEPNVFSFGFLISLGSLEVEQDGVAAPAQVSARRVRLVVKRPPGRHCVFPDAEEAVEGNTVGCRQHPAVGFVDAGVPPQGRQNP